MKKNLLREEQTQNIGTKITRRMVSSRQYVQKSNFLIHCIMGTQHRGTSKSSPLGREEATKKRSSHAKASIALLLAVPYYPGWHQQMPNYWLWNLVKVYTEAQVAALQTWEPEAWCHTAQEAPSSLVEWVVTLKGGGLPLNLQASDIADRNHLAMVPLEASRPLCGPSGKTNKESDHLIEWWQVNVYSSDHIHTVQGKGTCRAE